MFNSDFYPTPSKVIETMLYGYDLNNKVIWEPSAGKGDIVDYLLLQGAKQVIACEKNADLRKILSGKCKLIADDCLQVQSHQVSHIDFIVMNPPFSADEKHIIHAFEIAPAGCTIIALCNLSTVENPTYNNRKKLIQLIDGFGSYENLGACFSDSERSTKIEIALVKLVKPANEDAANDEFSGFFMEDEVEQSGSAGIMPYNMVRDLVNRYVQAIKIFDSQLEAGILMNDITTGYFSSGIAFECTQQGKKVKRNEFKKDLQKSGWLFIFEKLNMQKYATRGLKEDINKFVEKQEKVSFTMRNIYKMIEIVIGTQSSRMDKAMLEVFDKLTQHYDENRYNVEGWKTNKHYLMGEKFILPGMCYQDQRWDKGKSKISTNFGSYFELVDDLLKALCHLTGDNYDHFISLNHFIRYEYKIMENGKYISAEYNHATADDKIKKLKAVGRNVKIQAFEPVYGQWFDWAYFEVKAYKKGTMHFKFKDRELWGKFNQHIAKLKGYPLYETVKNTAKNKAA
jgi:hypothetical protein